MECNVCLEAFDATERRPKVLPCGHTFCLRCLRGLQAKLCPLDQKVFESAAEELADNYTVLQLSSKPAAPAAPRFWCRTCAKEAADICVDEHVVCTFKKVRSEEAAPLLEELQRGGAALDQLGQTLNDAFLRLGMQVTRALLQQVKDDLAAATGRLQDTLGADAASWTEAKQAAVPSGLSRSAAQLAADLADPSTKCKVTVQRGEAGGVAWSGEVRPAKSAAARLLLCQLACLGGLQQQDQSHVAEQQQGQTRAQTLQPLRPTAEQQRPPPRRWNERPNEPVLTGPEMAAKMKAGSRVARGKDWPKTWAHDGTPPGLGTVTSVDKKSVWVTWDCGGNFGFKMGHEGLYQLRLVPTVPLKTCVDTSGKFLNVSSASSKADITAMTNVSERSDLAEVRCLVGLDCGPSPPWSHKLLQQVAPNLEHLQMASPEQRHLDVVLAMPRLQALSITGLTGPQLRQVAQMASLRRLQVHCRFNAPLPVQELPPTRLQWLCCEVYPLAAALALVRASADTLEELQLVAASKEPYGCPDLAAELRRCGLKKLQKLWLLRVSPNGSCGHMTSCCTAQKIQLWNMFLDDGLVVHVACSVCNINESSVCVKAK